MCATFLFLSYQDILALRTTIEGLKGQSTSSVLLVKDTSSKTPLPGVTQRDSPLCVRSRTYTV